MYITLYPFHLPFIYLSWPYTARPWHWGHLSTPLTQSVLYTQKCFMLSTFHKTNMLQWSIEHIFPAHWVGLKGIFHATVSTEPFPKVLNSYLIFLIPPLILLCFYFSKHDMKAMFLYSFTFESSDVNRITLYHLQLNVSAQQMWNRSFVSLLSLKPAT